MHVLRQLRVVRKPLADNGFLEFQERRLKKQQYNPVAPNGDVPKPVNARSGGAAETKAAR